MFPVSHPSRFAVLGGVVAVALLTAACGSDGEASSSGGGAAGTDLTAADLFESPLAEYTGAADFFAEDGQQAMVDAMAEAEQAVAECMREQGFEYKVVDRSDMFSFSGGGGWFEDPFDREAVETVGFGISTTFEDTFGDIEEQMSADPNAEIRQSLSPSEQQAYDEALMGAAFAGMFGGGSGGAVGVDVEEVTDSGEGESGGDAIVNIDDFDPAQMGCQGSAFAAMADLGGGIWEDEELSGALEDLEERLEADPRMVDANADWSACMADAGHDFESLDEVFEEISGRMDEVMGVDEMGFEAPIGGDAEGVAEAFSFDYDEAALSEVQAFELDVAKANFDCQIPLLETQVEVRNELEGEFVEANREQLEALDG